MTLLVSSLKWPTHIVCRMECLTLLYHTIPFSFKLYSHIHLSMLILVPSNFILCSFLSHLLSFIIYSLECCCVDNMSPFISSSGLSPSSREAKVQWAQVCLNCTEPSVARSSCWSLPVGWYLSDSHCKNSVILARWTASNMAEELQMSISHQVRKQWTTSGSSDFCICAFISCSTFICKVSLPCIRQLLARYIHTSLLNFNDNAVCALLRVEWSDDSI